MTEAEWLNSANYEGMLGAMGTRISRRKARLFGCACCRRVWHQMHNPRSRRAVEYAEQYADGSIEKQELSAAR